MSKTSYDQMWENLNIDLQAHEALLSVLGKFYGDIYLNQEKRLKGAEYLDFILSEIHGLRVKELTEAKKKGKKIIGTFCVFVPEELVIAADAIFVGLCSGVEVGNEQVEKTIPRNTCALIKSFIGFKLARLCPFMESCDIVIGETTCDGKKKAYEAFAEHVPMYVMGMPQMKKNGDYTLFKTEVLSLKKKLEELTGNTITENKLKKAVKIVNEKRRVLQRLEKLQAKIPAPISGRDVLLINQISFYDDPVRFTQKIEELCDQIEERIAKKEGIVLENTPRLLLAGCPMAVPNWKLPFIIESSGAVISGIESCIGTRNTKDLVKDNNNIIDAICERYMKIDCACFTPNNERLENIEKMAIDLKVDGVINYTLSFCQTYAHEALKVKKSCAALSIPSINIETDYGMGDVEQLKTRIEAFIEMIKKNK